ncbi:unnamed protein product [Spodoptera exigua]|nr:unnamed protein product [Spodoptera exigua]
MDLTNRNPYSTRTKSQAESSRKIQVPILENVVVRKSRVVAVVVTVISTRATASVSGPGAEMHAACAVLAAWLVARAAPAASESARVSGAVRFGALFAVHGAPMEARAGAACGPVREHYGIQRVEATLMALDAINADPRLLPWLRLGADLRDSCWAPPTALRQTIDLVRDAIAPSESLRQRSPSGAETGHCQAVCTLAMNFNLNFVSFFRVKSGWGENQRVTLTD